MTIQRFRNNVSLSEFDRVIVIDADNVSTKALLSKTLDTTRTLIIFGKTAIKTKDHDTIRKTFSGFTNSCVRGYLYTPSGEFGLLKEMIDHTLTAVVSGFIHENPNLKKLTWNLYSSDHSMKCLRELLLCSGISKKNITLSQYLPKVINNVPKTITENIITEVISELNGVGPLSVVVNSDLVSCSNILVRDTQIVKKPENATKGWFLKFMTSLGYRFIDIDGDTTRKRVVEWRDPCESVS